MLQHRLNTARQCPLARRRALPVVCTRKRLASAGSVYKQPSVSEDEEMQDYVCSLLTVKAQNGPGEEKYTKLVVEVQHYPGLLRTVAWTLNGLGIRAQNATMKTLEDGTYEQTYWLTDMNGKKLSDKAAAAVQERLYDFIQTCLPSTTTTQVEWQCGNMHVSNQAHATCTELTIVGEPQKPGFLLEIASVVSAIGATVVEAVIQGDPEFPPLVGPPGHDFKGDGRVFRFLLADPDGSKLSPGRISSVLYMLDLVAGKGYQPTRITE